MVLDPSAYIAGLNRAAQHTAAFQSSIQAGTAGINAFAKASQSMAVGMSRLNGSVYASMTAFYALSRVVSSSLGVFEEYNNIISRISATADLSISSVTALSESFKKLNRELGGSRTDLMKGVYRAVQANFTTPEEFMPIGAAAMRLRTASGREINTTKSADVISVIRNSLGIKSGREGFITDMLLRGRDIGRYELTEMASALGIPITLFGNQFSAKLGPEETLRQLIAILSSATQTGLNPRTAATGTRRMVEKTTRLMKSPEGIGKNLTTALRSMGFSSISEALNQGPMAFLETISRLTGGSPEALTHLGYGSRDIMLLTSALRNNMGQTREFYGKLAPGEIGGTTDKYLDKHKQTWWYQRDRLRSAYEDSQLKLMQAMIPVLSSFANSLEVVNDLFQALAPSIKRLIGLMTIGAGFSILRNFYVRGTGGKFGAQGSDNLMKNLPVMGAGTPRTADYYGLRKVNVAKRSAQLQRVPASQIMGPTGPLFPQRYNRRATDGRFVPRGYDIRDWRGGIVPPSKMGSPVQQVDLGRRGAMYDSVSRFLGRASDNMQRFGEGYGKAKGWLKDSWLGKGGAFAFGGNEYRLNRIQKGYDERIEAANKAFVSGKAGAERGADWMRDTARQSGVNPVAASRIAAQHFNSTMDQVTKNFNKATASAANTAKWMSRLSGVMGTIGSVANMAAIGGIFSLVASFLEGLKGTGNFTKMVGGKTDMNSLVGRKTGLYDPLDVFQRSKQGMRMLGYGISGIFGNSDWRQNIFDDMEKYNRARGYVLDENTGKFKKATYQDIVERTLRENFTPIETRELRFAGYDKFTPEKQREFEKWLGSKEGGGYTGGLPMDLLQSATTINGMPANEWFQEKISGFMRSQEVQSKVTEVTTKRIAEMGKAAEEAGKKITFASPEYAEQTKLIAKGEAGLAFARLSSYDTMFALDKMQMKPYQTGRGAEWNAAYDQGVSSFIRKFLLDTVDHAHWGDDVLEEKRLRLGVGVKDRKLDPYSRVQGLNDRLRKMRFLAKHGTNLQDRSKVTDEMIVSAFGLDKDNLEPAMLKQIVSQVRGLDPSQWTEMFSPQKAPFSDARYYGTQQGYNATLERKEDPFKVELLAERLGAVVDSITATEKETAKNMDKLEADLPGLIQQGTVDIVTAINRLDVQNASGGWLSTETNVAIV
jgi:hypothetical protein